MQERVCRRQRACWARQQRAALRELLAACETVAASAGQCYQTGMGVAPGLGQLVQPGPVLLQQQQQQQVWAQRGAMQCFTSM